MRDAISQKFLQQREGETQGRSLARGPFQRDMIYDFACMLDEEADSGHVISVRKGAELVAVRFRPGKPMLPFPFCAALAKHARSSL